MMRLLYKFRLFKMILKHFTAGRSGLRLAANVPESEIRNKLNLNADDDCPEGAEALKEANFCKRRLRRRYQCTLWCLMDKVVENRAMPRSIIC